MVFHIISACILSYKWCDLDHLLVTNQIAALELCSADGLFGCIMYKFICALTLSRQLYSYYLLSHVPQQSSMHGLVPPQILIYGGPDKPHASDIVSRGQALPEAFFPLGRVFIQVGY